MNPDEFPLDPQEIDLGAERVDLDLCAPSVQRPRPTTPDPGTHTEALFGAVARLAQRVEDPRHLADLAAVAARDRALAQRALRVLAREQEVPEDEDLRAVALAPNPPETPALEAFRAAVAWCAGQRRGLVAVVSGARGTGKSSAMAWVLLHGEASALYVLAPELLAVPQNGFSENAHRWERWRSVPLLAIDDLGTETGDTEIITSLLWQRYERGRRTLLTTNLSREQLVARYFHGETGSRLADRLINAQGRAVGRKVGADGLAWFVPVAGESLRNAAARAALEACR